MKIPVVGCRNVAAILSIGSLSLFMCNSSSNNNPTGPGQDTSLKKQVSVSITTPNSSLSLGTLTLARTSSTISYGVYWMLPVTNIGSQTLPYVEIDNARFKNSSGAILDSEYVEFVHGSVMKFTSSGSFTNTCLQPGETGYIIGIQLDLSGTSSLYNSITSVSFSGFDYSTSVTELPKADVNGTGFSLNSGALTVHVLNSGTATAKFGFLPALTILRDSHNDPLMWTFLDTTTTSILAPNASCILDDQYFSYSGTVDNLLVFPDFSDTSAIVTHASIGKAQAKLERRAFGSDEEFLRALLIKRNNLEKTKRIQYKG